MNSVPSAIHHSLEAETPDSLLADYQSGHSDFQIEHFIVNRGNWTPWGRYCQALREIDKRSRGLLQLRDTLELARVELDRLCRGWCFRAATRRINFIKQRQLREQIERSARDISECERELVKLVAIASEAKFQLGDVSGERRKSLEAETWQTRLRAMAALDILTQGRITEATLSLLLALPRWSRDSLLQDVQSSIESARSHQAGPLISWLDSLEGPATSPADQPGVA